MTPLDNARLVADGRDDIPLTDATLTVDYQADTVLDDGVEYVSGVHKCPTGHRHVVRRGREPVTVLLAREPESPDNYCGQHEDYCYRESWLECRIKTGTGVCGKKVELPTRRYYNRPVAINERVDRVVTATITSSFPNWDDWAAARWVFVADGIAPTPASVTSEAFQMWSDRALVSVSMRLDEVMLT